MSKVLITRSKLDSLATTISAKSGEPLPLTIAQMDAAVQGIETGGSTPTLQSKTATPTTSQQTVTPDTGYDGLSQVTVNPIPSQYIVPSGTKSITENGTGIDVAAYASVDVNVPDNTFVVTLSYNDQTEMWEPDKTYAEIKTAYEAGKTIAVEATPNGSGDTPLVMGEWTPLGGGAFAYAIAEQHHSSVSGDFDGTIDKNYFLTTNGIVNPPNRNLWLTEDATATPSDVLSGKVFYGADGQHTGTATTPTPTLQSKSVSYTPSETAQSATVTAGSGYDGLSSVDVSVGAISSTYVGSGITQRSSTDLTASGATVTVPAGYYSAQASKAVASGTEGTPTATKGTVSNHSVSVTPSVTNTAGYITGGTKSGTAVSVSASELVSGTYTVSASGTHDVTNYASASVAAGGATASATKGTVSNHSVTVTPSVTRTAGYVTAGTDNGTAVTVSASELVSGTKAITGAGTTDVTEYASVSVASGGATASATKGAVSNHSVTVTPSVTRTAGWVTAGSSNGTAVTVSASELVSGSTTITENGTTDVTNLASVTVDIDFVTYHTSSSEPTSSQGSDGDIWLVTE